MADVSPVPEERFDEPVVEAPVLEEVAPVASAIPEVVVEPPPTPEIPLDQVRVTSEGVCLSKVARGSEGVILKVLEV